MEKQSIKQKGLSLKQGKAAKKKPILKVVYISNPMKVKTSVAEFRSVVQELTGQDSSKPAVPKHPAPATTNQDATAAAAAGELGSSTISDPELQQQQQQQQVRSNRYSGVGGFFGHTDSRSAGLDGRDHGWIDNSNNNDNNPCCDEASHDHNRSSTADLFEGFLDQNFKPWVQHDIYFPSSSVVYEGFP